MFYRGFVPLPKVELHPTGILTFCTAISPDVHLRNITRSFLMLTFLVRSIEKMSIALSVCFKWPLIRIDYGLWDKESGIFRPFASIYFSASFIRDKASYK